MIQENLDQREASEHYLITGRISKGMPSKSVIHLTTIFISVIRTECYPADRKVTPNPRKQPEKISLCGLMSLIPIISRIFEKALMKIL
jgi:hypothetical protein